MQYSWLVFEIVFYRHFNITDGAYKRVGGWEGVGWGGGGGWQAGGGQNLPLRCIEWCCPPVGDRYVHNPQDGLRRHCLQFHNTNSD